MWAADNCASVGVSDSVYTVCGGETTGTVRFATTGCSLAVGESCAGIVVDADAATGTATTSCEAVSNHASGRTMTRRPKPDTMETPERTSG